MDCCLCDGSQNILYSAMSMQLWSLKGMHHHTEEKSMMPTPWQCITMIIEKECIATFPNRTKTENKTMMPPEMQLNHTWPTGHWKEEIIVKTRDACFSFNHSWPQINRCYSTFRWTSSNIFSYSEPDEWH